MTPSETTDPDRPAPIDPTWYAPYAPARLRATFHTRGDSLDATFETGGLCRFRPRPGSDRTGAALELLIADAPTPSIALATGAVLAAMFDRRRSLPRVGLDLRGHPAVEQALLALGLAVRSPAAPETACLRGMLLQRPELWLPDPPAPFPLHHVVTEGKRHPLRPPVPAGTVYRRQIGALDQALTFRTVDPRGDLALFHRWMNDPRVDAFWEEAGPLDKHAAYLARASADPRVHALIGCFGGEPFGYFETYWAREDRIAPYHDVGDHDRGIHMAVGEPAHRGPHKVAAWLPGLAHYLFLADPRTRQVVAEPRADNDKMIRYLQQTGFYRVKHFDFPHKRAALMVLPREPFFAEHTP
jgi:acetyl CoA:N6-hydroxylysine acetyl transferase